MDDYSSIFLIDERYQAEHINKHLSKWVRDRMRHYSTYEQMDDDLKQFFLENQLRDYHRESENLNQASSYNMNSELKMYLESQNFEQEEISEVMINSEISEESNLKTTKSLEQDDPLSLPSNFFQEKLSHISQSQLMSFSNSGVNNNIEIAGDDEVLIGE